MPAMTVPKPLYNPLMPSLRVTVLATCQAPEMPLGGSGPVWAIILVLTTVRGNRHVVRPCVVGSWRSDQMLNGRGV